MRLDEISTWLNFVAHQVAHGPLGLGGIVDVHLEKRAGRRLHRGLPQLVGVHFAETLVALHIELLGPLRFRRVIFRQRARKRRFVIYVTLDLG